jgi:hypothetical protein
MKKRPSNRASRARRARSHVFTSISMPLTITKPGLQD